MTTVVLAWELGGGYGHMLSLAAVGKELQRRGHQLVVAARGLERAEPPFGGLGVPIFQAPIAAPPRSAGPTPLTVGETLRGVGYDCVENFGPVYRAWRVLLESIGGSLLVADFAPTALLAARGLGIPRVGIGTGYTVPPRSIPTADLTPWDPPPRREEMLEREGQVLSVVNQVLSRCGDPPLTSVAAMYEGSERFLLTFAALDHFGPRDDVRYWGPLAGGHGKVEPQWPAGGGPRLFVYVNARYWGFERLIGQLSALAHPTLVFARDLDADRARSIATENIRFASSMVDIDAAAKQAALVVSHGGHGTTSRVLLGGCPLLVLPEHGEQALLGHRLSAQELAIDVGHRKGVQHDYAGLIRRMLEDGAYRRAAERFAEEQRGYDQAVTVAGIANRCEALIDTESRG